MKTLSEQEYNGEFIRSTLTLLRDRGWTVTELANRIGMKRNTLSVKLNEHSIMKISEMISIATTFGVSLEDMLGITGRIRRLDALNEEYERERAEILKGRI